MHMYRNKCLQPFKGRKLDKRREIEVYRNLNRGGYSIRQDGLVVAHADNVMVKDATFVVNGAGWRRMRQEGRRNVHAWVRGLFTDSGMGTSAEESDLPAFRYDRKRGVFISDIVTPGRVLTGARIVALNKRGGSYAYGY